MTFGFEVAKSLYTNGMHPRVMLGPQDVIRLRDRTRSGAGRKLLDATRQRNELVVKQIEQLDGEANDSKTGAGLELSYAVLLEIAMVGVLDQDDRMITAAVKLMNAPQCADGIGLTYDLLWHHLSPQVRRSYCERASNGLRDLDGTTNAGYYRMAGGNKPLHRTYVGLMQLLAIMGDPGAGDLSLQLAELLRRFEATLNVVFNPNGYPEEDIGYGTQTAGRMGVLVEATRRAGLFDAYRDVPGFVRFGQAILHFVQPWGGFLSNTGDHGDDFDSRELILARLAAETQDATLLWLLGTLTYGSAPHDAHVANRQNLREVKLTDAMPNVPATVLSLCALADLETPPVHPRDAETQTHYMDPKRGIVSFRSGWRDDDTLLIFDSAQRSPAAQGHAHDSCGHFSISARGEYFAIDTGRYNNEQSCHNVVLIDGKSGRSTQGQWRMSNHHGVLTEYAPNAFVDFAAVDSSHQHNCFWAKRYIALVKGAHVPAYVWTVDDINKHNDMGEYWWQLHTSPENVITFEENHATIRGWRCGNLLDVHFALPHAGEYKPSHTLELEQDVATPSSFEYIPNPHERAANAVRPSDQLHHAGFTRPRLLAKVKGLNGRFMSIMLPYDRDETPARVERLHGVENTLAVRITFAEVNDTLIFAYDHNLLDVEDIRGRGQWCVVRRSQATGEVLSHAIGHGTTLEVAGCAP